METMKAYFQAERYESLLFMAVGLAALALGFYFYASGKDAFFRGMALPLLAVALIQLTVGYTIFVRSPRDIVRVENLLATRSPGIRSEEIPRMQAVMKNFAVYRSVEIALIGLGLLLLYAFPGKTFVNGVGLGLFAQAALMLTLDVFAERRGAAYLEFLLNLL